MVAKTGVRSAGRVTFEQKKTVKKLTDRHAQAQHNTPLLY